MKKIKIWLSLSTFVVILAACGDDEAATDPEAEEANDGADPTETEEEDTTEDNDSPEEEGSSEAEDILTQSMEAMEEVNSYSAEMEVNQTVTADGEEIPMDSSISMDIIQEPMSFSQVVSMPDPMSGEEIEIEQYMDEDGTLYMFEPTMDEWVKMDAVGAEFEGLDDLDISPQEQIELLMQFTDNLTLEEEDDRYAINVEGSGDELLDLSQELIGMQQTDPQMEAEMEQLSEQMSINVFDYTMYINKDTFYQEGIEMNFEMEMEEEGETIVISQEMTGTFSNFGEIDAIDIPQEAIDEAVDMEEMYGDLEEELELEELPDEDAAEEDGDE